ncbi:MAG: mechanosensitive ion channel family protein [Myxococcota bacterium]
MKAIPLPFVVAALVLGLWAGQAWADVDRCSTPRKAIEGLLHWQKPGQVDLEKAAACLDLSLEESSAVAPLRARQIKEVLDGNGLFVKVEEVPGDADYQDEAGRSRYVPFPRRLPRVWVEKVGDRWLWSASTVSAIPELHRETFAFDAGAFEQRLPEWARGRFLGVEAWKLLGLLALILVAVILRAVVMYLVASQARSFMARIRAEWGRTLLARIDNPIGTLAAVGLVAILLPALQLPVRMTMVSLLAVRVLAAFSAVWAVYRLVDVASGWLEQKAAVSETKLDDQLVPLVRTALKVFIVAIGIVFVLQNLSVDVAGLVAGLGLGGLAVALAARETVANLFGAVTVFLDKPFQIGDWIVLDGNHGVVEQVGFRSTRLRTFYNSVLTVPNATLAAGLVDNYGARQYRRVSTTLGLTYDTRPEQMQAFVEGIRAIIQANPCTRKDFYEVHFNDFGSHSLNVMVYFFLKVDTWSEELRERHNIMLEILRLAEELRVSFAFPTTTLNFESLPAPGTMRQPRRGPENMAEVVQAFGPGGAKARPGGPRLTHGFLPSSEKASTVAAHSGGVPGSAAAAVGAQIAEEDD